jgi:hypothetical protein
VTLEERAESIARYVHTRDHPISAERLQKATGIPARTLTRAAKLAREKNWLSCKLGPAGGYCAGAVAPPELVEKQAA